MLRPWLLLTHFSAIPTVSASLRCFPFAPAPPLADCRHVTISMLSLPAPLTDIVLDPQSLHSYDSPFFPHALFHHGDCIAKVSYFSESEPARHADWIDDPPSPRIPLSQPSIFKLWTAIKTAAEDLNDACIAQQRTGSVWNDVGVPEIKGAWILVEIFMGRRPWWQAGSWTEQARRARLDAIQALRDYSRGHWGQEIVMRNKYEVSVLYVP